MKKNIFRFLKYFLCDIVGLVFSLYLSAGLYNLLSGRSFFDANIIYSIVPSLFIIIPLVGVVYALFGLYTSLWRYFGAAELLSIIGANIVFAGLLLILHFVLPLFNIRLLYVVQIMFFAIIMMGVSILIRIVPFILNYDKKGKEKDTNQNQPTMIIGAGNACDLLLRELSLQGNKNCVRCIIDDNKVKHGTKLHGIPIVGDRYYISEAVAKFKIKRIIFAIPSMTDEDKYDLLSLCKSVCKNVKSVPSIIDVVSGVINISSLTEIDTELLLGRDSISADMNEISFCVKDKTILVTGGGGSIGSELCRQIAKHGPQKLIILDIYENNAYAIQQELIRKFKNLDLSVEIASVRDELRINYIFEKYKPQLVFHAAAHKHVPLMEDSPQEAVKNNVFGTLKTVKAAIKVGVEKFVLISTDKAVNPTNVMGATKRICEMIIQTYNAKSKTELVAVRFGNVLGSNGSVIPLFLNQIKEGGPVTVTHEDIIRYFMTIPEAVSLVLEAASFAKGGEIYVLDMGKPVKIVKLAENLIKLSGYVPYKDIAIKFTGLRPGEKLYEELLMAEEGLKKTENNMIYIGKPMDFDENEFTKNLEELSEILYDEKADIKRKVAQIVTTYKYGERI